MSVHLPGGVGNIYFFFKKLLFFYKFFVSVFFFLNRLAYILQEAERSLRRGENFVRSLRQPARGDRRIGGDFFFFFLIESPG